MTRPSSPERAACETGSPLLQCRGPERRLTPWQVLVALLLVVGFVWGAGALRPHAPDPAAFSQPSP